MFAAKMTLNDIVIILLFGKNTLDRMEICTEKVVICTKSSFTNMIQKVFFYIFIIDLLLPFRV